MGFLSFLRRYRKPASPFVESLGSGPPDPAFVGELLVHSFVDSHFGLSNDDLNAMAAPLPDAVRAFGPYWITLFLCWMFRIKILAKHGDTFFGQAFEAARARLALADATAGFAEELARWFQLMDRAAGSVGQTVQGVEVPMTYFAALTFCALTPESPYFQQKDIPSDLALDLAGILEQAKQRTLKVIEFAGDVASPAR